MQEAIPYRSRIGTTSNMTTTAAAERIRLGSEDDVKRKVEENAVTVVGRSGCCMTYVVTRLLQGLGANPAVFEVAADQPEDLPAVYIGGQRLGGLERVMASHITGELTPLLKQAGALWL